MNLKSFLTYALICGMATASHANTIANDVNLSEYVPAGDRDGKIINFGQASTIVYDDLEIMRLLNVSFGIGWVELGDVITQSTRNFGLPAELAPGETKYFGFFTTTSDVMTPPPWETIGWMQLTRTADTGELLLLGSATNYGELLDPIRQTRGPASGITVGLAPEPNTADHLLTMLVFLLCVVRKRRNRGHHLR